MNNAGRPNAAREKLRINTNIRTRVHHDSSRGQGTPQQLPLRTISVSFESAITQAVDRKGVFVNPVPYSTKKRDRGHQRGVSVTVKKDAQKLGKR